MKIEKKLVVLLSLVLIICSMLCACGIDTEAITSQLLGEWQFTDGGGEYNVYLFEEDTLITYSYDYYEEETTTPIEYTYEIGKDVIKATPKDSKNSEIEIKYTYDEEKLSLKKYTKMDEEAMREAIAKEIRKSVSFEISLKYQTSGANNVVVSKIEISENGEYVAYGKVTCRDNYGDTYSANFDADGRVSVSVEGGYHVSLSTDIETPRR